jgi:hypothetical protein
MTIDANRQTTTIAIRNLHEVGIGQSLDSALFAAPSRGRDAPDCEARGW